MDVYQLECERAGLDPGEVRKIARGLGRYALQAERLGLTAYGASTASLRFQDARDKPPLIVATLDGDWDGGDGATHLDEDGLRRGER
jgi:hypothetical protein